MPANQQNLQITAYQICLVSVFFIRNFVRMLLRTYIYVQIKQLSGFHLKKNGLSFSDQKLCGNGVLTKLIRADKQIVTTSAQRISL